MIRTCVKAEHWSGAHIGWLASAISFMHSITGLFMHHLLDYQMTSNTQSLSNKYAKWAVGSQNYFVDSLMQYSLLIQPLPLSQNIPH